MPFLQLNGLTVQILDSKTSLRSTLIGDMTRGLGQSMRKTERAQKRVWSMRAKVQREADAIALIGMLLGRGHGLAFDRYADDLEFDQEFYTGTAGGLLPSTAAVGTHYVLGSGDGSAEAAGRTYTVTNDGKYGARAVSVDSGPGANILTEDLADCIEPSDWTGINAFSIETSPVFVASAQFAALSVISDGTTPWGLSSAPVAAAAATAYVGDIYVRGLCDPTQPMTVSAYLRDEVNAIDGTPVAVTLDVGPSEWKRIKNVTLTTGGGSPTVALYITADTGIFDATQFWISGASVRAGTHSPAWSSPSAGAPAGNYQFRGSVIQGWKDMTINMWLSRPATFSAARTILEAFAAKVETGWPAFPRVRLDIVGDGSNVVRFQTRDHFNHEDTIATTGTAFPATHALVMVTAVMKHNPRSGEVKKEIWLNGTRHATSSPALLPDFTSANTLSVLCNQAGAEEWSGGVLDDLIMVPWAAPSAQIAAWYASTRSQATFPHLVASGDALEGAGAHEVLVYGAVDNALHAVAVLGGATRINAREIEFTLEEV